MTKMRMESSHSPKSSWSSKALDSGLQVKTNLYFEMGTLEKSESFMILDEELLEAVREVSEDHMYDTIEFNEFLQMMSKQQKKALNQDALKDAFKIFDKDDDGFISVEELRRIMKNLGDKMTDEELDEMLDAADTKHDGLVNYSG